MSEMVGVFITWTTYGTWLPGDARGWRSRKGGQQLPDAILVVRSAAKLISEPVVLRIADRFAVEAACHKHCNFRDWTLHAVNARTNHVHVVVSAYVKPQVIRDQLKANCTQSLRAQADPLFCERTWTKGGDCQVLFDEDNLFDAIDYVKNAQD